MSQRVLIIEDDPRISQILEVNLRLHGFESDKTADGQSGLELALKGEYALIILDLELPKLDGIEVCRRLREENLDVLVLMLTARGEELDKVIGLEVGADDYLAKPFGVAELMARVKAMLRRTTRNHGQSEVKTEIRVGQLRIEFDKRKVVLRGTTVELSPTEFDLLALLASNPGRVFSRAQILKELTDSDLEAYENSINTHVMRLRKKIEKNPSEPEYLITVWGIGYRFAEPEQLAHKEE